MTEIAPKPDESVATLLVHELLRARRLERGLTVEKVRDDTKIPMKYVLALEEGRYNVFPAQVYLRGFFLSYVKYLSLGSPAELWERLRTTGTANAGGAFGRGSHTSQPKNEALASNARVPQKKATLLEDFVLWTTEGQNWILAYLVFPTIVIGAIYGVYSYLGHQTLRYSPERSLNVPELLGLPQNAKEAYSATPQNPLGRAAEPQIRLELAAKTEPTWMQVELDDKLAFQGILPAAQKRAFQFTALAKIKIGNPKSVDIRVNGVAWPISAEEQERTPLELKLTPKNVPLAPPSQ